MLWLLSIIILLISFVAIVKLREDKFWEKAQIIFWVLGFISLLVLIFTTIITVPAGYRGVVYDPFAGGVQIGELKEGLHFVAPWREITLFSLRTQAYIDLFVT